MNISPDIAVQRYSLVRDKIRESFPKIWDDVLKLRDAVPKCVTPRHVWLFGRDKPCWSNITVNIGERIAADILKLGLTQNSNIDSC